MQAVKKKTHCKFMFRNRVQTQLTQTLTSWLADTRFSLVFHLRHGLPEVARGAGSQEQTSLPFPFLSWNSISNIFQPWADVWGVGLALVARNLLSSRCKAIVVSSAFSVLVSTAGSAWIPVRPDMSFVIISSCLVKQVVFKAWLYFEACLEGGVDMIWALNQTCGNDFTSGIFRSWLE
jgi:hypothetical protein